MPTTKARGTAEPSADRAHDINMLHTAPRGEVDLGDMPGMENSDFGRNSPQFHSADAACRHLLPPGIVDDGSGP